MAAMIVTKGIKKIYIPFVLFLWFLGLLINYLFNELLSIHSEMYLIVFINV